MTTLARRDDAELAHGFAAWCEDRWPGAGYDISAFDRPRAGWTNETLLISLKGRHDARRLVVRLPPAVPTWKTYDLGAQARVLSALAPTAVPVPELIAYEDDDRWLGAAFLVMSHEDGRPGPEAPVLDEWVTESPLGAQRALHERFIDTLASVHRIDWRSGGLGTVLRGGEARLAREVAWWADYVD